MIGLELAPGRLQAPQRVASPLAQFFAPGGGQHVAIAPGVAGGLSIWTEIGGDHAACLILDNNAPGTRLSWRETLLAPLRSVYPVGDMVLAGSWTQMQSSGSGLSGSYTGNRAISGSASTATATVTVDRAAPYDLWINYTGRTSGGYMRVEIDGTDTLVNEIDDPASLGFKAFSTYAPVDLTRRMAIRVASGLSGSHTVTLRPGGAATPGGSIIMPEAVAISADLTDPRLLPPLWSPGTAYAMGDEVQWQGVYYAARASGTSGATAPTHATGIASDGALDWRADHRPTYPAFVAIDYASEREYALRFDVSGSVTELGGQTHGNEPLVSRAILLDGQPWSAPTGGEAHVAGNLVSLVEDTTWQTQSGTALGDCQLTRTITPGGVRHDVVMAATGPAAAVEWAYPAMLPMVCWDGESAGTVVDTVTAPDAPVVTLQDHAGSNPPNIGFAGASRIGLLGAVAGQGFRYGLEAGVPAAPDNPMGPLTAFLRPNLDARTASGSLDWTAKAYIATDDSVPVSFGSGDTLRFFSRHVIALR